MLYCPGLPTVCACTSIGTRVRKKAEEVHKMANLAENAAASLLGIVHPMIGREYSPHSRGSGWRAVRESRTENFFSCTAMGAKRRLNPTIKSGALALRRERHEPAPPVRFHSGKAASRRKRLSLRAGLRAPGWHEGCDASRSARH